MKTLRDKEFNYSRIEPCRECSGSGFLTIKGYDYGHGWSRDEKHIDCAVCNGTGRVLVHVEGRKTITSFTADEWPNVDPMKH